MAATGIVVQTEVLSHSPRSNTTRFEAHVIVKGSWAYPFHAELSRERLAHSVISLFKEELEVGDPLFDDNVWVETADRSGTGQLLQSQGAQSALLQLVGMPSGKVTIGPGELRSVQDVGSQEPSLDSQILATCALARHLQPRT